MAWGDDNPRDRAKGDLAEREAYEHMRAEGLRPRRHPWGQTGPDIGVEHQGVDHPVEVRAKTPDRRGRYGLEQPKYQEWCERDVIYAVKDTQDKEWRAARMRDLPEPQSGPAGSYRNGKWDPDIPNDYWPAGCWVTLAWDYR